jgi:hypothetical protein
MWRLAEIILVWSAVLLIVGALVLAVTGSAGAWLAAFASLVAWIAALALYRRRHGRVDLYDRM